MTAFRRTLRQLSTALLISAVACFVALEPAFAHDPDAPAPAPAHPQHGNLAEIGKKLSNPVGNVWALFTQFGLSFSDGDINSGDSEVGGNMVFQPILPLPLWGKGDDQWKLIVRPTIPLLLGQPTPSGEKDHLIFGQRVPTGEFNFNNVTGLADTMLPLLVSPPASMTGKSWLFGAGPTFMLPTATRDELATHQWSLGPAAVIGYKTPKYTIGVFPQWHFGIKGAGQGSAPDTNQLSLLYFAFYNLPDAWQIGFNPTATYNRRAKGSNAWNVPIGLLVAKTTKIGKVPTKIQFGMEYSVVSQEDFGKRFLLKLNLIPVIPSLVKKPLLGGG